MIMTRTLSCRATGRGFTGSDVVVPDCEKGGFLWREVVLRNTGIPVSQKFQTRFSPKITRAVSLDSLPAGSKTVLGIPCRMIALWIERKEVFFVPRRRSSYLPIPNVIFLLILMYRVSVLFVVVMITLRMS